MILGESRLRVLRGSALLEWSHRRRLLLELSGKETKDETDDDSGGPRSVQPVLH